MRKTRLANPIKFIGYLASEWFVQRDLACHEPQPYSHAHPLKYQSKCPVLLPEQDVLLSMIMAKPNEYFEESATQTYLAIIRILVPPLQTIFFFFEHPVYLFRQLHQLFRVLLDFGLFAKIVPKVL